MLKVKTVKNTVLKGAVLRTLATEQQFSVKPSASSLGFNRKMRSENTALAAPSKKESEVVKGKQAILARSRCANINLRALLFRTFHEKGGI